MLVLRLVVLRLLMLWLVVLRLLRLLVGVAVVTEEKTYMGSEDSRFLSFSIGAAVSFMPRAETLFSVVCTSDPCLVRTKLFLRVWKVQGARCRVVVAPVLWAELSFILAVDVQLGRRKG
jgi:hypothetical protein